MKNVIHSYGVDLPEDNFITERGGTLVFQCVFYFKNFLNGY